MRHSLFIYIIAIVAGFMASCTNRNSEQQQADTDSTAAEQAMNLGQTDRARRIIMRDMARATDSTARYSSMLDLTSYYAMTMQADSMLLTLNRIDAYTAREGTATSALYNLWFKSRLQRGVYYARMAPNADSVLAILTPLKAAGSPLASTANLLTLSNNLADAYKLTGQYDKAVGELKQALQLADSTRQDSITYMVLYMGIAAAYTGMRQQQQSDSWWEKTGTYWPCMGAYDRFLYLNNRGSDLYYARRYADALGYFIRLDSLCQADDMEYERWFASVNRADCLLRLQRTGEAAPIIERTDTFFQHRGQHMVSAYIAMQKAALRLQQGRTAEAARILATTPPPPQAYGTDMQMQRLEVMQGLYLQQHDTRRYADATRRYHHLNDSLRSASVSMAAAEALMAYEHDKRLLAQHMQLQQQARRLFHTRMAAAAAVAITALLCVIGLLLRSRRRQREASMRNLMLLMRAQSQRRRITPHFIFNALTHEQQAAANGHATHFDTLLHLLRRGEAVASQLCVTLQEELDFIAFYAQIEGEAMGAPFCYRTAIDPRVDPASVTVPSMIVQIFVENAIKHGLRPMARAGTDMVLTVKVEHSGGGTLVSVLDNGVGLPPSGYRANTGLKVVAQTVQILRTMHHTHIDYGVEPRTDGPGCRSWLFVPSGFRVCEDVGANS